MWRGHKYGIHEAGRVHVYLKPIGPHVPLSEPPKGLYSLIFFSIHPFTRSGSTTQTDPRSSYQLSFPLLF